MNVGDLQRSNCDGGRVPTDGFNDKPRWGSRCAGSALTAWIEEFLSGLFGDLIFVSKSIFAILLIGMYF